MVPHASDHAPNSSVSSSTVPLHMQSSQATHTFNNPANHYSSHPDSAHRQNSNSRDSAGDHERSVTGAPTASTGVNARGVGGGGNDNTGANFDPGDAGDDHAGNRPTGGNGNVRGKMGRGMDKMKGKLGVNK